MNLLYSISCFVAGLLIAILNTNLSKKALRKGGNIVYAVSFARSALNVGLMVAVFFICRNKGINITYPLVAAAFGLTIPTTIMAASMVKEQKKQPAEKNDTYDGEDV